MNLKINIWTMSFYSNMKIDISILKTIILILNIYIWIWKLLFQLFKTLFEFQIFDLNMIFEF